MRLFSVIDAVTPIGTGVNARVAARFFSASKSWPAMANSCFAWSSVIQPSMAARPRFLSVVTRSNCSVTLLWTTENGYAAGPVSWTMKTAAAFFSAPISYL